MYLRVSFSKFGKAQKIEMGVCTPEQQQQQNGCAIKSRKRSERELFSAS